MTEFEWPHSRWVLRSLGHLAVRPWLWVYTLRFMPLSRPYMRFRLATMYGNAQPRDPMDLIHFLEWVRQSSKTLRARRRHGG